MKRSNERRRGRGRPAIHDPRLIRRLLVERSASGETYVDLETRSGIPASTLSRWSRRLANELASGPAFVELVAAKADGDEPRSAGYEIVVTVPGGERRVIVPAGFDAVELRRLLEVVEGEC